MLPSPRECIAYRIGAKGTEFEKQANKRLFTRAANLYVLHDGKWIGCTDDIMNPKENIVHVFADDGYALNNLGKELIKSKSEDVIKNALERAIDEKRFYVIPETANSIAWSIKQENGVSEYGQAEVNKAVFQDMAESNANFINNQGYRHAYDYISLPRYLNSVLGQVNKEQVLIMPVRIGSEDFYIDYLFAGSGFRGGGLALGVRETKKSQ